MTNALSGSQTAINQFLHTRRVISSAVALSHPAPALERSDHSPIPPCLEFLEGVRKRIKGDVKEQPGLKAIKRSAGLKDIVNAVSSYKGEEWEQFVNRQGDWGRDMVLLRERTP